jgi:hypothetical protein
LKTENVEEMRQKIVAFGVNVLCVSTPSDLNESLAAPCLRMYPLARS